MPPEPLCNVDNRFLYSEYGSLSKFDGSEDVVKDTIT